MSGLNYGLCDSLQYFEFEFDSFDAITTPDSAAATTDWPLFTLGRPMTNIAAIKILECQIPFSYYIFNSKNNTFTLTESAGGGATTVTLPAGNYSTLTMITALETALDAASANSLTYTVTFAGLSTSPNTGKFTVTNNGGGVSTFTLTFGVAGDGRNTNPSLFLGFASGANISDTSQTLEAPFVASITGPNYVYVNSNTLGQQCNLYLPTGALNLGKGNLGPQMAKIPITTQPGGVNYWQDPNPLMW